jgi:superfamily I DNA/RNA helicase
LDFPAELLMEQEEVLATAEPQKIYIFGNASSGKTTAAALRLQQWLDQGISAANILILGPQRSNTKPYQQAAEEVGCNPAALTSITMGGIARRMCQLFWPIVVEHYQAFDKEKSPSFLTLETAQYFLSQIIDPLLDQGFFSSITIDRNRLYSQILDNLNKSSLSGISLDEITQRLINAWVGEESQINVYKDAQICAEKFRAYCYENNLLDYSLQMEIFNNLLWQHPLCRAHLTQQYTHLIYDNIEEDPPIIHKLIDEWLPNFHSAVLVHDTSGGFRLFMGADPINAGNLKAHCQVQFNFDQKLNISEPIQAIQKLVEDRQQKNSKQIEQLSIDIKNGYDVSIHRFVPQMLDWIAETAAMEIEENHYQPGDVVILSPFVSDSLFFSLANRLEAFGYKLSTHRPSRSLKDESATRMILTFARLAHPKWALPVTQHALRTAFMQSITDQNLLTADRLSRIIYNARTNQLNPFNHLKPDIQEQITYQVGERYEAFRNWIEEYQQQPPMVLDSFIGKLFGELLSQPGFTLHEDFASATVIARLMTSIKNFRWLNQSLFDEDPLLIGKAYVEMVERGILAATSYETINNDQQQIMLLPAYTYLSGGYHAQVQFWLDPGNPSWAERLYQPLTHPYVLSPNWPVDKPWTQLDETQHQTRTLYRIINGLLLKCKRKVYFCISKVNEQGLELKGPMLAILQDIFRTAAEQEAN